MLFRRAMQIVDAAGAPGTRFDDWSFGGGTVLMRRFRHRVSKDVDIFVPDPQYLGYVSPRLNDTAESLTSRYLETAISVKLYFPEGEIDFIASAPLTEKPTAQETVLGRRVDVETTAEIIAKKVWHRGRDFTARDLFDLALVSIEDGFDQAHRRNPPRPPGCDSKTYRLGRETLAQDLRGTRYPGIPAEFRRMHQGRRSCPRQELAAAENRR